MVAQARAPGAVTVTIGCESGLTGHGGGAGCLIQGQGFDIPAHTLANELARVLRSAVLHRTAPP